MELARRYGLAAALVRPCDVDLAVRVLGGGSVRAASVCGYPHGYQNTATKLYELRDLLRRGAKEIDMVVPISKLLSREFQYVQTELLQAADSCHQDGAVLKVILKNEYLTDELKTIACRCCERADVDIVQTTVADIPLVRRNVPPETGIKVAGLQTLDEILAAVEAGATRVQTGATAQALDDWKARLAAAAKPTAS